MTVCVLHDVDQFGGRFLRESMADAFGNPKKVDKIPDDSSAK